MEHRRYLTIQQRETLQRLLQERGEGGAALERVHEPDFGLCMDCAADIPFARLQADPSARRCIACQAGAEGRAHPPAP